MEHNNAINISEELGFLSTQWFTEDSGLAYYSTRDSGRAVCKNLKCESELQEDTWQVYVKQQLNSIRPSLCYAKWLLSLSLSLSQTRSF